MENINSILLRSLKRKESLMILILVITGLSFLGWFTHKMGLAAYSRVYVPIAPSTASIFIVLCLLFIFNQNFGESRILKPFITPVVLFVGLFCLLVFLDYLLNYSWDIEYLFKNVPEKLGDIPIGRMSPITALLFIFICAALMGFRHNSSPGKYLAAGLSLIVNIISAILFIGYLYKAPLLYGGQTIPVALPTVICFILFSLTLLWHLDMKHWTLNLLKENVITYQLLRIFLPTVILIVLFQGILDTYLPFQKLNPALSEALIIIIVASVTMIIVIRLSAIMGNRFFNAEQALKDSETKFREFFEANSDGIAIFSLDPETGVSNFLDMNENSAKMLGFTKEEMLTMNPFDFEKNITNEEFEKRIGELNSVGISNFETQLRHKNGSDITVEIKATLIIINDRPVLMNIVRDITERKRMEEALKVWNIKFRKLSSQAPGLIFQFTRRPDGTYFVPIASEGIIDIFGCSPEDVLKTLPLLPEFYIPKTPGGWLQI